MVKDRKPRSFNNAAKNNEQIGKRPRDNVPWKKKMNNDEFKDTCLIHVHLRKITAIINAGIVKHLKKELTIGLVDVEVIEYISGIDVVVYGVGVNQPFYIIQELASDIVLEISWVIKFNIRS
ncbi:7132_t:CDS:2 [Racocetra persica]|uniref:7132_t:CDS:1 n=1 Tax=Racocetra persica TaxID=160502 RepID=A0ACA9P8E7_9GLOM|nr:7132_t:CDS:2 [Racocetra persica]